MFKGGARGRLYFLAVSAVTGLPKALQIICQPQHHRARPVVRNESPDRSHPSALLGQRR